MRSLRFSFASIALTGVLLAQIPFDPSRLLHPSADSWPMYNGDYSGRRFSPLKKINANNVNALTLAWMYRASTPSSNVAIKATPLQVNGVLYFSAPDHAWAVDARTGREIWRYEWQSSGR